MQYPRAALLHHHRQAAHVLERHLPLDLGAVHGAAEVDEVGGRHAQRRGVDVGGRVTLVARLAVAEAAGLVRQALVVVGARAQAGVRAGDASDRLRVSGRRNGCHQKREGEESMNKRKGMGMGMWMGMLVMLAALAPRMARAGRAVRRVSTSRLSRAWILRETCWWATAARFVGSMPPAR